MSSSCVHSSPLFVVRDGTNAGAGVYKVFKNLVITVITIPAVKNVPVMDRTTYNGVPKGSMCLLKKDIR